MKEGKIDCLFDFDWSCHTSYLESSNFGKEEVDSLAEVVVLKHQDLQNEHVERGRFTIVRRWHTRRRRRKIYSMKNELFQRTNSFYIHIEFL